MKLFLLILGIVVVALNVFLWYSKKHSGSEEEEKSPDNNKTSDGWENESPEILKSPEADKIRAAAAAELGIPVGQLNSMSAAEIELLAAEKGLID